MAEFLAQMMDSVFSHFYCVWGLLFWGWGWATSDQGMSEREGDKSFRERICWTPICSSHHELLIGSETHFGMFVKRVRVGPGLTMCNNGLIRSGVWVGGVQTGKGALEVAVVVVCCLLFVLP